MKKLILLLLLSFNALSNSYVNYQYGSGSTTITSSTTSFVTSGNGEVHSSRSFNKQVINSHKNQFGLGVNSQVNRKPASINKNNKRKGIYFNSGKGLLQFSN